MVNSFAADFARVATLQYHQLGRRRRGCSGSASTRATTSCRTSRTRTTKAQEKLTKINKWFCEQLAYLAKRLAETPEHLQVGGQGEASGGGVAVLGTVGLHPAAGPLGGIHRDIGLGEDLVAGSGGAVELRDTDAGRRGELHAEQRYGAHNVSCRARACSTAASASIPASSTANSSPPRRATIRVPTPPTPLPLSRSRCPVTLSNRSPALCPRVSLTSLKSSRSSSSTAAGHHRASPPGRRRRRPAGSAVPSTGRAAPHGPARRRGVAARPPPSPCPGRRRRAPPGPRTP